MTYLSRIYGVFCIAGALKEVPFGADPFPDTYLLTKKTPLMH